MVIENGRENHLKNVVLAVTNKDKSLSYGIKIAINQNRNSEDLTLIIAHGLAYKSSSPICKYLFG